MRRRKIRKENMNTENKVEVVNEVSVNQMENNEVVLEETVTVEETIEEVFEKVVEEVKLKVDNNSDIFITEKDRFNVDIKYYLDEKREPIIEGFDESYDDGKEDLEPQNVHSFTVEFKYPSQRDTELIMAAKPLQNIEDAQYVDFIELENVRLMTLLRGWSMERPLSDLALIHPKIIKALRNKISLKIAGNGLL